MWKKYADSKKREIELIQGVQDNPRKLTKTTANEFATPSCTLTKIICEKEKYGSPLYPQIGGKQRRLSLNVTWHDPCPLYSPTPLPTSEWPMSSQLPSPPFPTPFPRLQSPPSSSPLSSSIFLPTSLLLSCMPAVHKCVVINIFNIDRKMRH